MKRIAISFMEENYSTLAEYEYEDSWDIVENDSTVSIYVDGSIKAVVSKDSFLNVIDESDKE